MNIQYALQHYLILVSALAGIVCGAVYDVFRLMRAFSPRGKIFIFIQDVIYCVFVASVMTVLFFNYSQGRIRIYAFVVFIAGFSAYYFTVGKLTKAIYKKLSALISRLTARLKARIASAWIRAYVKRYSKNQIRKTVRKAGCGFGL